MHAPIGGPIAACRHKGFLSSGPAKLRPILPSTSIQAKWVTRGKTDLSRRDLRVQLQTTVPGQLTVCKTSVMHSGAETFND